MSALTRMLQPLFAILATITLVISTSLFFIPIFFLGLLKLIPIPAFQLLITRGIDKITQGWVGINNFYVKKCQRAVIQVNEPLSMDKDKWYIVVANHQSWLDIVLLQTLFNGKIPQLKFFIKDSLKWIPLLGFAWWAMGSPFMKRYSREYLLKKPHKKGKDLVATQKALSRFKKIPSSVMNFIEGTRFTRLKKTAQKAPFEHLLNPKPGGIGFSIHMLADKKPCLIDVTIVYSPKVNPSLWNFLCQRMDKIIIHTRIIPIPPIFLEENVSESAALKSNFNEWLQQVWHEKDHIIDTLRLGAC